MHPPQITFVIDAFVIGVDVIAEPVDVVPLDNGDL
jgi:hypothetical protein